MKAAYAVMAAVNLLIIALLPALCVAVWQFGAQVLVTVAASVSSAVFFAMLRGLAFRKSFFPARSLAKNHT